MFELALKAGLPLIQVSTDDKINLISILRYYTDGDLDFIESSFVRSAKLSPCKYLLAKEVDAPYEELYEVLAQHSKTLILVADEPLDPCVFDAGELPVPKELIGAALEEVAYPELLSELVAAFGGVSLREVGEIARLTMADSGSLTARGVLRTRRLLLGNTRGLMPVNTDTEFYQEDENLTKWVDDNILFFLDSDEPRLVPRGILFHGQPGTGKTLGAKYIANRFGLPLYHFDLGSMMGKWVGESENNLKNALSRIDREEPCVILIDEVEKLFNTNDDSGVAVRMLGQLLWWLQEHTSRVFTVMTTNDIDSLPGELYRAGRIDQIFHMPGIKGLDAATKFTAEVVKSFDLPDQPMIWKHHVNHLGTKEGFFPQAALTQYAIQLVKEKKLAPKTV